MRDGLNAGLPSDRFQVDWWIRTRRVERRLGKRSRGTLGLSQFQEAEIQLMYSPVPRADGLLQPPEHFSPPDDRLVLAEIPPDFLALKSADLSLARDWRFFSREVFETCFAAGFIITDFIFDRPSGRSLYVLADGDSTLGKVL
jgi:predicted GNAT superfamily acetyltransferase